jgi:hypothetical protein
MRLLPTACFLLALTVSTPAAAQLTVVAEYRMGENDTSVVIGGPANAQTLPGSAGVPLQRFGSPVYAGESAPSGLFSNVSIRFDGSTARYQGPVVAMPTNNFGVEAWVRANSTVGNALVVYNGNSGNSGFGIFRAGANWSFLYGGVTLSGNSPVTTAWTHLAIVRDGGVNRFFINGSQVFSNSAAPNSPAGTFNIGGNSLFATEFFDGLIDEVRLFTFAPGGFAPGLLNTADRPVVAVPTLSPPGSVLLAVALILIGLLVVRPRP